VIFFVQLNSRQTVRLLAKFNVSEAKNFLERVLRKRKPFVVMQFADGKILGRHYN